MQFLQVLSLERYSSLQHCVHQNTKRPYVHVETFISLVCDYLRSQIRWCSALLLNHLALRYQSTDSEVTHLYRSFIIHKDIVKFDVSVQYASAMAVSQAMDYLLEDVLGLLFLQLLSLFDVLKQVTTSSVLHDHEEMLGRLKHFKQSNYVGVSDLLEDVNLLEDLLLREVILHVGLVNCLNCYLLAS